MAKDAVLEGVFAINKPMGMSSAQVIRDCQSQFRPSAMFAPLLAQEASKRTEESEYQRKRRQRSKKDVNVKMGHGGTLDPLATGVLILGIGSGTKTLSTFLECTKTYETVVLFGAATDTYDRVGKILTKRPYDHITRAAVEKAMDNFKGKFQQIPPLYSALKMEGKPLYEYAREGKPIPREIPGREVEVSELELLEWYEPGSHNHRWPTEEAEPAEKNLAEQVWRVEKQQGSIKKLTAEEEKEDEKAVSEHESFKRKFEERQDELVRDQPAKRQRIVRETPLMSGALGQLPSKPSSPKASPVPRGKGSNLIPPPPPVNTPPPWTDKGPAAAKIRMTVTSGFYVRSFCHDLGVKVGSVAVMAELCRSRQSDYVVGGENCLEYTDLAEGEKVWGPKVSRLLAEWQATHPAAADVQNSNRNSRRDSYNDWSNKKRKFEAPSKDEDRPRKRRNSSSEPESAARSKPKQEPNVKATAESTKLASETPPASSAVADQSPKAKSTPKSPAKSPAKTAAEEEAEWEGIKD